MRTGKTSPFWSARMLDPTLLIFVFLVSLHCLLPEATSPQGETTSAIIGQVSDATGAAVPNATVTVTNSDTGLRRSASTDDSGRFNFPQLKPGIYTVKVEAEDALWLAK
jgi:protocatechuate 3,4-dioxygenase beta subunit